jgi:hypothetical protein
MKVTYKGRGTVVLVTDAAYQGFTCAPVLASIVTQVRWERLIFGGGGGGAGPGDSAGKCLAAPLPKTKYLRRKFSSSSKFYHLIY